MKIFPAIDLKDGKVVRLAEGDYDRMSTYNLDPALVAESFRRQGAWHLHVVDLDGARDGSQRNLRVIERIVKAGGMHVQVGGGARDEDSVKRYFDTGVDCVILGTMAVEKPALMEKLGAKYPEKIAVAVDAKGGRIAIRGWRVITELDAFEFMKRLPMQGIYTAIYTDIAHDGMLEGPNLVAYRAMRSIGNLDVVASGGVSSEADLIALREIGQYGVIIGKALYEGQIDLARALEIAEGAN